MPGFDTVPRRALVRPLVLNRTGEAARDDASLPELVTAQLVHPVLWARSLVVLSTMGITDFVVVGPGRVLRGLVRENLGPRARVHLISDLDDVDRVSASLRAA